MGIFGQLFGRKRVGVLARGRGWTTEVVGEAQFQDDLLARYR